MVCVPGASAPVNSVATPPLIVPVPNTAEPSRNCTLPVAVTGATVAVKVTACCGFDGLTDDVTVTLVSALTSCAIAGEIAGALLASPAYVAVIECVPGVRVETARV